MKKLHEYTLEELAKEMDESTDIQPMLNEESYRTMTPEEKIKTCNGISAEDFLNMWIQDIKEVCRENGYN